MSIALGIIIIILGAALTWFVFSVGVEIKNLLPKIHITLLNVDAFFNQLFPKEGRKPSEGTDENADTGVDYKKTYPEGCTEEGGEDGEE